MPKGGGRGYKGGHKGQRRHFTSPEELEAMREKEEREREWREQRGDESSDEEKEPGENKSESGESGDESSKKKETKPGDEALEVDNPNRIVNKSKKINQLDLSADAKPELSRKEREEIEKQRAKANYQRLHAEGKTDEARSDLARLAIIKKQREEAAKKREDEKKAKEAAKAAKTENLNKALGKGRKT